MPNGYESDATVMEESQQDSPMSPGLLTQEVYQPPQPSPDVQCTQQSNQASHPSPDSLLRLLVEVSEMDRRKLEEAKISLACCVQRTIKSTIEMNGYNSIQTVINEERKKNLSTISYKTTPTEVTKSPVQQKEVAVSTQRAKDGCKGSKKSNTKLKSKEPKELVTMWIDCSENELWCSSAEEDDAWEWTSISDSDFEID